MTDLLIGDVVREKRLDLQLTQEQLCEGICEPNTLSRIENHKCNPTRNHINALLKRLGLPEDRYYTQIRPCEYEIQKLKAELHFLAGKYLRETDRDKVCENAASSLVSLEALISDEDVSDQQFIVYMRTLFSWESASERRLCAIHDHLLNAIQMSLPRFATDNIAGGVYSLEEIRMIELLGQLTNRMGKKEHAFNIFKDIYLYVMARYSQITYPSLYLPLASYHYADVLLQRGEPEEALNVAQNGLQCCLRYGYSRQLPFLVSLIATCHERNSDFTASSLYYRKAYALFAATGNNKGCLQTIEKLESDDPLRNVHGGLFKELMERAGKIIPFHNLKKEAFQHASTADNSTLRTLGSIILEQRELQNISQPVLCAGFCPSMTLSRFERGKQTPVRPTVLAFVQRLGMSEDLFYSHLTDAEATMESLRKSISGNCFLYEKASGEEKERLRSETLEKISTLRMLCNGESNDLQQFIESQEARLDYPDGITLSDKIDVIKHALRRTQPMLSIDTIRIGIYTKQEVKILLQLANYYDDNGQPSLAIDILEQLAKCLQKKYPEWPVLIDIFYNLALTLAKAGRLQDALCAVESGYFLSLQTEKYTQLPGFLHLYAECNYCLGRRNVDVSLYSMITQLYRVMGDTTNAKVIAADAFDRLGVQL